MDETKKLDNILKNIYYNIKEPSSFSGINKLFTEAKKKLPKLRIEDVKNWLSGQSTYTLYKPIKRKFNRLPILVDDIDEQWQADLMEMTWYMDENDGYKYLLVVIDVLSRYAFIQPLKNKETQSIIKGFEQIFQFSGRKPKKLQTDQGKEFVSRAFQLYLRKNNIHFFTSTDDVIKCSLVERLIRTLRERINKYLNYVRTDRYIDVLNQILLNYNNSIHRTIEMKPSEVNQKNLMKVRANIRKNRSTKSKHNKKINVGDDVRIGIAKNTFEKGTTANWSDEIFKISKVKHTPNKTIYKLKDWDDEPLTSIYYPEEVQKVKDPKVYAIEKVLKRRTRNGKKQIFVKWTGWPNKFNEWIDE